MVYHADIARQIRTLPVQFELALHEDPGPDGIEACVFSDYAGLEIWMQADKPAKMVFLTRQKPAVSDKSTS